MTIFEKFNHLAKAQIINLEINDSFKKNHVL